MKVYRLRLKLDGRFYQGKGYFSPIGSEGRIYTSKGHIKNSLKQANPAALKTPGLLEIVTYNITEEKTEDL